jgi:hypothetical protein
VQRLELAIDSLLEGVHNIPKGGHPGPLPLGDLNVKPRFEAADDQRKAHRIDRGICIDDGIFINRRAFHIGHTFINHFSAGFCNLISIHVETFLSKKGNYIVASIISAIINSVILAQLQRYRVHPSAA